MGERWQQVSHCHPSLPPLLTFSPRLTPASQRAGGRGDALQAMSSPQRPHSPLWLWMQPCGHAEKPPSLPRLCGLLLRARDPDAVGAHGEGWPGVGVPVAAVSLTQSPHTQSCPGNRAALCGVMGPGAPVPAHKEPLDVPAPHSPEAEVPSHPPSAF